MGVVQACHPTVITGIPNSLKKNRKFWRRGGVSNFGIRRAWGVEHFGISKGKGGG